MMHTFLEKKPAEHRIATLLYIYDDMNSACRGFNASLHN